MKSDKSCSDLIELYNSFNFVWYLAYFSRSASELKTNEYSFHLLWLITTVDKNFVNSVRSNFRIVQKLTNSCWSLQWLSFPFILQLHVDIPKDDVLGNEYLFKYGLLLLDCPGAIHLHG